ncbi:MAG: alpha/beta fold hydrolase [Candidatus Binatia bacterium]
MTNPSGDEPRSTREFVIAVDGRPPITIRGIEWRSSDPRPILFLHGGGANAEWWADVAPAFTDLGTVIALDLRGHGDSDWPPGGPYGFTAFGGDVLAVIEQIGRPVALVGASMGGLVAMFVAARSPLVERLVVVDSPLRPATGVSERRKRMSTPKRYASREEAIDRFRVLPSGTLGDPATVRRIAERSIRELPDGTWQLKYDPAIFSSGRRGGAASVASRIRAPLLFLRGERSDLVSEEDVANLRELVPAARTLTLAGANHHLFLDDPEGFVALIRPFLAERS